jgi:hypothetical protein
MSAHGPSRHFAATQQFGRSGAKRTFSDRDYLMSEKGAALKREILIGRFVTGTTIVADDGQMVALRG